MSRAANVTLVFDANLTAADQAVEAFTRRLTAKPITLPVTAGGASGGGQTTFASPPGTPPASAGAGTAADTAGRFYAARIEHEQRTATQAYVNLTAAINAEAAAHRMTATAAVSAVTGQPAGAAGGGGIPFVEYGGIGPGRRFRQGIRELAEQEKAGGIAPEEEQAAGGRNRGANWLYRRLLWGGLGYHIADIGRSYSAMGTEERLAVSPGGQTDLRRQLSAEMRFADRIAAFPIVGQAADYLLNDVGGAGAPGFREQIARTQQEAERKDLATELVRQSRETNRRTVARRFVAEATNPFDRARRTAQAELSEGYIGALGTFNETVAADPSQAGMASKVMLDTIGQLERINQAERREITRSFGREVRGITAGTRGMGLRATGDERAGARADLEEAVGAEVEDERHPMLRLLKFGRGQMRLGAFDEANRRQDSAEIETRGFQAQYFQRQAAHDPVGALEAQQRARRREVVGTRPWWDPRRIADEMMLTAQEGAETGALGERRALVSQGLAGEESVSGLLAQRRPYSARIESIRLRAELDQQRAKIEGLSPQDQARQLQIGINQLELLRIQSQAGGSAEQVSGGAFGPGGTEGTGTATAQDFQDMKQAIVDAVNELKNDMNRLLSGD